MNVEVLQLALKRGKGVMAGYVEQSASTEPRHAGRHAVRRGELVLRLLHGGAHLVEGIAHCSSFWLLESAGGRHGHVIGSRSSRFSVEKARPA
jgi:hypothetical protein